MTSFFDSSNHQAIQSFDAVIPDHERLLWHGKLRPVRYVRRLYATTAVLPIVAAWAAHDATFMLSVCWWIVGGVAALSVLLWMVSPTVIGLTKVRNIRIAITNAAVYEIDIHKRVVRERTALCTIPHIKRIRWGDGGGDIFLSCPNPDDLSVGKMGLVGLENVLELERILLDAVLGRGPASAAGNTVSISSEMSHPASTGKARTATAEEQLNAILLPGEQVLWSGAPNPIQCAPHGCIYAAIGPFSLLAALLTFVFGLDGETHGLLSATTIVAGVGFAVLGLGLIAVPFVLADVARGTRYAVTNLRILIVSSAGRYCLSVGPNQIDAYNGHENTRGGHGTISFNFDSNTTHGQIRESFLYIKNPEAVRSIIESAYKEWSWLRNEVSPLAGNE